jgi:DNA polymerase III sliding clamp (beta) subunit (PCNA family)
MKREDILSALSAVDPAVAANDLIPVLTHYWFTGKQVMAFNDVIAISVPYETEFKGAIRSSLLSGILSKLDGSEVTFTVEDGHVIIKSRRSRMKVPLMSTESFLFEFPKVKTEDATLTLTGDKISELAASLDICLQSLSRRVSEPQRLGVTVVPGKKSLGFYATDSVTMSAATIAAKGHGLEHHVTLAKPFCESALKMMTRKGVDKVSLFITDDYAMLVTDVGKLHGRLVDDPNPPKFKDVIKQYMPGDVDNYLVDIPEKLSAALDRAHLVIHKALEPVTKISVGEDKGKSRIRISAKSEQGEVSESIEIDEHVEVTLKLDLVRFRECDLSKFDKIYFDSDCVVLASGRDMYHLLSTQS